MYSMTARGPRTETQRILRKINGPSKGIPDGSFCLYNIECNYPLDSFLMYRMDSYFVVSAQYCVVVILRCDENDRRFEAPIGQATRRQAASWCVHPHSA